jgi:hypothetical protein
MDKQPTDEQIKEFWEWCGFEYAGRGGYYENISCYKYPDGKYCELPPIDLNNLFSYYQKYLEGEVINGDS